MYHLPVYLSSLRLDYGDDCAISCCCAFFLISQLLFDPLRHAICHIKAKYHSYQVVCLDIG